MYDALAGYERRRNESTSADYQQNLKQARFEPPAPDLARLRASLRGRQEEINQFYLAYQGMIPRERFFNPANMQRLMASAGAAR